ncbi:hypothetical protein [Peredibacter starrii]|uniref:Uncharacterized protein n=1 Tax=Peredibacter starrii TaxID=28202 RepID=A0AAX4HVD6_9BACT|nr:hypothetical protein [Peredibacter starrii]WPU67145.1 hypothetical protein SOO65_10305 [Peredibacter starrii]
MKTLLALFSLTFAMTTFADCRIAFEGSPASYFSRAGVHKKGFKLIELKNVQVGDYINTYENYNEEGIRILGENTGNIKVQFVHVIKRVTEYGAEEIYAKEEKTTIRRKELDHNITEAPEGVYSNTRAMNALRVKGLPSCRKLNRL